MVEGKAGSRWRAKTGLLGALFAVALAGCSSQPHAAAQLSRFENERPLDTLLSDDEQREVVAAMKTVAEGHVPDAEERIYVREMRWSDLQAAVSAACDRPGVEMVILDSVEHDWGTVFHLRTVEDRPAVLEVRRTHDERIYEATATIGRFNLERDNARAGRLLEELDRAMQRYAGKKRLPEDQASR